MSKIRITAIFLTIYLTGVTIAQQLPAGLDLPPHWQDVYELVSWKNGELTYRDKATAQISTLRFSDPQFIEERPTPITPLDTLPVPSLDTLYADTVLNIDVANVDTAFYARRFYLLGEVPLRSSFTTPLVIYDFNQNGIKDILGLGISYEPENTGAFNWFYEWQQNDSLKGRFVKVFGFEQQTFDKGGGSLGALDIDNDGRHEAYFVYNFELRFYEADTVNGFPDTLVHTINKHNDTNPASALFYDFDRDGKTEFHLALPYEMTNIEYQNSVLWEHQSGNDQFLKTYRRRVRSEGAGNTVVGDMDGDDWNEFYFGSLGPNNFVTLHGFENEADNRFAYQWRASIPVINLGRSALPGDMDSDGLPEIVLNGDNSSFVHGRESLLTFIESNGDNSLVPTVAIAIRGGAFQVLMA